MGHTRRGDSVNLTYAFHMHSIDKYCYYVCRPRGSASRKEPILHCSQRKFVNHSCGYSTLTRAHSAGRYLIFLLLFSFWVPALVVKHGGIYGTIRRKRFLQSDFLWKRRKKRRSLHQRLIRLKLWLKRESGEIGALRQSPFPPQIF